MYEHTQRAPLALILSAVAAAMAVAAWAMASQAEPVAMWCLGATSAIFVVLGLCFGQLTVRDEGTHLQIMFGPLPVFSRQIDYDQIESAEKSRSALIDGLGIHWLPGRGTTYNLWGYDCVQLIVNGRVIRIGTDDAENLAEFLRTRIAAHSREPVVDPAQANGRPSEICP